MNKKILLKFTAGLLSVVAVASSAIMPTAETTEEKKAALQEKISALNDQIAANQEQIDKLAEQIGEKEEYAAELNAQIEALQSQIDVLDQQISLLQASIDTLNAEIKEKSDKIIVLEEQIAETEAEIEECEAEIEKDYDILKSRIRSLYVNGQMNELEVFFESTDFASFLINLELIDSISKHDTAIINDIKSEVESLAVKKASIEESKAAVEEAKALLEEEKAEVEVAKNELDENEAILESSKNQIEANWDAVNSVIAELDQESDAYKALNEKAEKEKEEFAAQIDALVSQRGSTGTGESSSGFVWPLQYSGVYISCHYGQYSGHGGTDITMPSAMGKDIQAVAAGTVIIAGWHWSYGNYIVIDHGNGLSTYYAHCSALYVSVGQSVSQGEVIGAVGSTGNSTGPHLHFEVRVNGSRRNPENYLP